MNQFKNSSVRINSLLQQNEEKLNKTFSSADEITSKLNKLSDSLSQIKIGRIGKELEVVLSNFKKISNDLSSGTGTAGKLLKDEKLYANLTKTSKELELLLQDLRLNPTRYINVSVFGKKNKPYKQPKDSIN